MAVGYPKELEVQRLVNITSGFGWEKVKEEVIGKDVVVTFKKEVLTDEQIKSPPVPS